MREHYFQVAEGQLLVFKFLVQFDQSVLVIEPVNGFVVIIRAVVSPIT